MAPVKPRVIVHLDADAFFVSVEQVRNPALRGKKVAVGGLHRGIISSASYEARACGVYTPMPTQSALRVCPDLIVVPHTSGVYGEVSRRLFALCHDVTPYVEQVSIDEGYLDLTPCGLGSFAAAAERARRLQDDIERALGLTVSFGVAANMLVAGIASKLRKPRGFTVVPPGTEAAFLAPLGVGRLPGIGAKTEARLKLQGIETIDVLRAATEGELESLFGDGWRAVRAAAFGQHERELELEHGPAKSHSQQETFARDIRTAEPVVPLLKGMIDELVPQLRADGVRARCVTVRIRYSDFNYSSASHTLPEASDLETVFYPQLAPLLARAWKRRDGIRLASVKLSDLETQGSQLGLFDQEAEKRSRLARAVDAVRERAGKAAVVRGSSLGGG
ncbi:Y-family DNA polymerase [Nibricoccus sp. IMCC34717]|uniref:Y-family DNA polymerase n=1 Tax=Nibricoccus sp. IMCC34717 TaxID=3034021 RepID=UPI00384F1F3A